MEDCGLIMWISSLWFWSGWEPDRRQKKLEKSDDHINFFTPLSVHCCSLLNISMSLLSTKWSRAFWKWASLPNFLVDSEIDFHHLPFWVGAAMGFWERDMHICTFLRDPDKALTLFIPALDDNSHQPLPLGNQIIPLLFRWSPSWYNCSKNTV